MADGPYEPVVIPKCTVYKVATGEICGFTEDQWKVVLEADAELVHVRVLLAKERERSAALALQVDALKDQVDVYAKSQSLLTARADKLTNELIECDRKYQNERVKPRLGSPLAWTITTIAVATLGGYLLRDKL